MTTTFWAPGRVNLIGDHTDYSGGLVLPVAIHLGIGLAARPGKRISLVSDGDAVELSADGNGDARGWGRYVAAVAQELAELGRAAVGIDGIVESDLPPGAGLGSSGALEVVVALALCAGAIVFVGGAGLQFIARIAPILGLFFGGWLVSAAFEPGVNWLARYSRMTRASAVAVNYLVVVVLLCLAWLSVSDNVSSRLSLGFRALPPSILTLQQRALQLQADVNAWLAEHVVAVQVDVGSRLDVDSLARQILDQFLDAPWGALTIAINATGAIASVGLVLLLSVYFLTGGPGLVDFLVGFGSARDRTRAPLRLGRVAGRVRQLFSQSVGTGCDVRRWNLGMPRVCQH